MYSRKTGTMYNQSEAQKKIESFNNNLREQYNSRATPASTAVQSREAPAPSSTSFDSLLNFLSGENIIIIGLIVLLLFEENKDFLLIGILAVLLLLNS